MNTDIEYSAEQKREIGKSCFFGSGNDREKKIYGIRMIMEAHREKDAEATFIVARLLLDGVIKMFVEDPVEYALSLMCASANRGCIQARAYLNFYCTQRYKHEYKVTERKKPCGALRDFDGKPIKIKRKGVFTPVDAVLEYKDGRNILTLSTNVMFLYGDEIEEPAEFEQAVYNGLLEWQGEYEVFGGQRLEVRVELTNKNNLFDNLVIMPMTDEFGDMFQKIATAIGTENRKKEITDMLTSKRSFATLGFRWKANSRKVIYLQSKDGKFNDYNEIMHVTKHEFGHALGLGDLYNSEVDSLCGVEKGTFPELDSYAVTDKYYNLVMCDHHGPVSNNDIEMVVLAFRDNKMQNYQPRKFAKRISEALGKGN